MAYLDHTFVYEGTFYGPGETDIPDALAESLRERGFLDNSERTAGSARETVPPAGVNEPDPLAAFPQLAGRTIAQVQAMSDEELYAINGVRTATVVKIRRALL